VRLFTAHELGINEKIRAEGGLIGEAAIAFTGSAGKKEAV